MLTFLDSHCEVTEGWLQPLLHRIAEDPSNVVCPVINAINADTFRYQFRSPSRGVTTVGGFNWNLIFTWHPVPAAKRPLDPTSPVLTPTMAGGLFSINKRFFYQLGGYDPGFDIWGEWSLYGVI